MSKGKRDAEVGPQDIDFDEATITSFSRDGDVITLELETTGLDEPERKVRISLQGIKSVRLEDAKVDDVSMILPDAEVFSLSFTDNHMELVAQWNDFANKLSVVKAHDIRFESMSLQVD